MFPTVSKRVLLSVSTRKRTAKVKKNTWNYHAMLFPGMVFVVIFSIIPMLGSVMAFQNFTPEQGLFHSQWVGLQNFRIMAIIPDTVQIFTNTLIISVSEIVLLIVFPVLFALLLNEVGRMWFKRTVQTIIYMPHFLSWVILSGLIINLFSANGLVDQFLQLFGLHPIQFMQSNIWFRPLLIGSYTWTQFGFDTIVYLAALTAISPSLYEASAIDGANRWQQTIRITLPSMMPTIILMSTLSLGNILNANFEQVFLMYNPLVYPTVDIIDTWVYRTGLVNSQFGLATAMGLLKSVVGFVMIVASYALAKKFSNYRIF